MSDVAEPPGAPLTPEEEAAARLLLGPASVAYTPCEVCATMPPDLRRTLGRSPGRLHRATWGASCRSVCPTHGEHTAELLACRPCQRAIVARAPWTLVEGAHGEPVNADGSDRYLQDDVVGEWVPLFGGG